MILLEKINWSSFEEWTDIIEGSQVCHKKDNKGGQN
jgi:hypothetical protein